MDKGLELGQGVGLGMMVVVVGKREKGKRDALIKDGWDWNV